MDMRVYVLTQTRVGKGMYVKTRVVNITMTKYIEVLQCNNHISSYLCDVLRWKEMSAKASVYPIRGSKNITCRECPKGARFLVRHREA